MTEISSQASAPVGFTEDEVDECLLRMSNWGRWGPDDQRGLLNLLTPQKAADAAGLVTTGSTVSCGRLIEWAPRPDKGEAPLPPHHFMFACGEPVAGQPTSYAADWAGLPLHGLYLTHLDAPSHVFWKGRTFNGASVDTVQASTGASSCAVDLAGGGIVTKGVLLDIPRLRGVAWLRGGDAVNIQDLEMAEASVGATVESGDVLLVRTGYGGHRPAGRQDMSGLAAGCLDFLWARQPALVGTDCGTDLHVTESGMTPAPIHVVALVGMGMWILDNCELEQLAQHCAETGRWEFLIMISPLRMKNSTGSPVNPLAIF